MRGYSRTPPVRTIALDERLVRYDVRASIAHAEMLHAQRLLSAADLAADTRRTHGAGRGARARRVAGGARR